MNKKIEKDVKEKKVLLCKDCRLGIKEIANAVYKLGLAEGQSQVQQVINAITRHQVARNE